MEKKQESQSHAGLSAKVLIAALFIISGILLFARNMAWISYELFDVIVSWHSLLIILGVYTMAHRHYISGIILVLIGAYFLIGGLSYLPENSQAFVWPVALIIAGVLIFVKVRQKEYWINKYMCHNQKWAEGKRDQSHMNADNGEQQNVSEDGFLHSNTAFGATRHVVLDELFKGASIRTSFGGTVVDLRRTHIAPGKTYIDVDCSWGGIELFIPSDWKVVIQCNAFLGGCEDERWKGANINQECILIIRGSISFSGLVIKD
ncbi:LiaF transmembrane domain-containing protein [Bacteroides sp. UBA939]|uniref:LiaF transmembrane domain-containing protein n=1 Tax=Bacteroides sp. UBA939 TaxID=1946092 RepID=UPI0025BF0D9D|nr:DUF5668 domain-containing protein [Bacteroides sp. UBA939]